MGRIQPVTCDHCGKQVPDAVFCTNCGAHQGLADHGVAAQERPHHFAAHPGEHVAQPSIFTTLFPHLGHRKLQEFRWALLLGFALVVVLTATGLITAAVVVSVFLVPTLYVVYLYEAQVYRSEPALVLGATLGGGIVLGLAVTIISERVIGGSLGSTGEPILSYGVILPVIQLIVMPIPALLLRVLPQFGQTIDGLVFGVTAGIGFALAEGVVSYWNILTYPPLQPVSADWIYPITSLALLIPLLHGSTAGAVAATLWRPSRTGSGRWISLFGVPIVLLAVVAFYAGGQILDNHGVGQLIVLFYQTALALLVVLYIRQLVHHSLMQEGLEQQYRPIVCPHCHHHVMAAGFCPSCGVALDASPRRETGLLPVQAAPQTAPEGR
jgi:RsiW-degrading membrane proteinase PrsW (M82 family)